MEQIANEPITFSPYLKSVIWGGDKICKYKGIAQDVDKIGESWEISAVPGHVSVVDSGKYAGMSLTDLINRFGAQLLGEKVCTKYNGAFPLLIKLIDADDNLSVQVHPDDRLARARHDSLGKTEMWYIISADPDARIYSGLNTPITPDEYEAKVADGTFTDVLATHSSNPGDVFFLPAGRVHAIGAGNLLAEIQESSDITYRIFDYNRRDADGNTRELHTGLAKDAIDYTVYDNYKSESPSADIADAEIVNCSHFDVRRVIVDGESLLNFSSDSFTVIICLNGTVSIGGTIIKQGHSALLPATFSQVPVKGHATLLTAQSR